jgi:hypothetical protein
VTENRLFTFISLFSTTYPRCGGQGRVSPAVGVYVGEESEIRVSYIYNYLETHDFPAPLSSLKKGFFQSEERGGGRPDGRQTELLERVREMPA